MDSTYSPPLALTIISTIFIGLAGLVALWILFDVIVRKEWKSMMAVMIPVYVLNALYLAPITLWTYLNYGRPSLPSTDKSNGEKPGDTQRGHDHIKHEHVSSHDHMNHHGEMSSHAHMHHGSSDRPMFATITVAVCHCGAGCLLGDIVGEWLVYGSGATINGRGIWPEFLIDYAFALLFGIVFQYFSIAPMSGEWGPKTVLRAAKADFLSLTFFEIGLFGWMAIFQIEIFRWRLEMNTVVYWWMMQIGMFLGHGTAFPINWWLIKSGIKEPCA